MIKTTVSTVLLTACLGLSGCLIHSGIVTDNLSHAYVPEEQMLLIAGTTATAPELQPFIIDEVIPYEMIETSDGRKVESKTYTNERGDQLVFKRGYDAGTDQHWESVTIRPKGAAEYTLDRLKGFLGSTHATAYGFYF